MKKKEKSVAQVRAIVAKLNWQSEMRKFFGPTWTKRGSSKIGKDGFTKLNTRVDFESKKL